MSKSVRTIVLVLAAAVLILAAFAGTASARQSSMDLSPQGTIGMNHLRMLGGVFGYACTNCHDGSYMPAPVLGNAKVVDKKKDACASCHGPGEGKKTPLFISLMPLNSRCSDCHPIGGK